MSIKIVMLKSGEDVIADVKEIVNGEIPDKEILIGYNLDKPYVVKLFQKNEMTLSEEVSGNPGYDLMYTPWAPLSADSNFSIPSDWVVTIYEPHEEVKKSYVSKMEIVNEHSGFAPN